MRRVCTWPSVHGPQQQGVQQRDWSIGPARLGRVRQTGATVCLIWPPAKLLTACMRHWKWLLCWLISLAGFGHAVQVLVDDPVTRLSRYVLTDHAPPHRATQEWLLQYKTHSQVVKDLLTEDRRQSAQRTVSNGESFLKKHQIEEGLKMHTFDRVHYVSFCFILPGF